MKLIIILIIISIGFLAVSCNKGNKKEILSKDVSSDVQLEISESQQLLNKGKIALEEKNYSEAKVYYEKAISLDKSNKYLYLQVKDDYLIEERYDDAYDIINAAINNNVDTSNMEEILESIKVHFPVIELADEVQEEQAYYPPNNTVAVVNGEEVRMNITWNDYIPTQLSAGNYIYEGYSNKYGRTIRLAIEVKEKEIAPQVEEEIPTASTEAEIETANKNPIVSKVEDNLKPVEEPIKEEEQQSAEQIDEPMEIEKVQYTLEKCYLNNGNISVGYPEVRSMKDENIQKIINDNIFSKVEEIAAYYQVENPNMIIDYSVKEENDILSLVYTGEGNFEGAAYPMNFFYTTNIEMNSGNVLRLSDLVSIDDTFILNLKAAPTLNDSSITNYFSTLSDDDIINKLNNSDTINSEVQSYLTESGSIGVTITVPHALGDHLEYEVSK